MAALAPADPAWARRAGKPADAWATNRCKLTGTDLGWWEPRPGRCRSGQHVSRPAVNTRAADGNSGSWHALPGCVSSRGRELLQERQACGRSTSCTARALSSSLT